jgi:N-methylhydantoinase A
VERGIDPRTCALVAFGGGGPLHACRLAERLEIRRILVPPAAGVLSALGLALAAERREALASVMLDSGALGEAGLAALIDRLAAATGAAPDHESWLRARFRGQGHEIEVPVTAGMDGNAVAARFIQVHDQRFGFSLDLPVEIISARHAASGKARQARFARRGDSTWSVEGPLRDDGGVFEATVHGPATIALADATMRVERDWVARSLPIGGWEITRQ